MHIDSFFAFSNSKLSEAEFVIYGVPYDQSQTFRSGSRFAPNAIREASWNLEEYSPFFNYDLSKAKIHDYGNINTDGGFEDILSRVKKFLLKLKKNVIPIALGGEHTITYASTLLFDEICYVVFDAHLDLRSEFNSRKYSHACTLRRIYEDRNFEIFVIGVRSFTLEEKKFAEKNEISYFTSWDVINGKIPDLDSFDKIYVSLDVDVFDPSFAPGVSTPEPFGLNPIHFLSFLRKYGKRIVGMDITEVIPDQNFVTQTLAAKIVAEVIASKKTDVF